ncbi:MAG: 3'(2'),5'-bisphosphate nucleotidase [Anaerolineae bacterium]
MKYARERQIAIEAVTLAAQLCRAVQAGLVLKALEKDDRSPVTVADFGSQAVVCRHLHAAFPADPVVAEEDSTQLRQPENAARLKQVTYYVQQLFEHASSPDVCRWMDYGNGAVRPRYWTLDPIDGTKGFLRREQYAIALALVEGGQVQVAALACPNLLLDMARLYGAVGVLFVAVRGQGAQMAPLGSDAFVPVRVTPPDDVARLRFVESVEAAHGDQPLQKAIAEAVGITAPSLRMDSQVKYGVLARGDAALYLRLPSPKNPDYREKIWDHAAGSLIVEEAGGTVTDMHGRPLDFAGGAKMETNRGVVASSGAIHPAVLAALTSSD